MILKAHYFLIILSIIGCKNPEPETYLLPRGFTGRVNVIFSRKDGVPPRYENGRRVYEIPPSGILVTQFKDEYGLIDHDFFYIDKSGNRTSLKVYKHDYNKDGTVKWLVSNPDEIGIFSDGTTGQYGNPPDAVWWQEFVVSSYNKLDSLEPLNKFEERVSKAINLKF
jgi:hypothetical protein